MITGLCYIFRMSFDDDDDDLLLPRSSSTDEELTLPRAAINKMIKEKIPNFRVANDARELILQCSTEFIHLLSSEASEICDKQQKKTITPEHALLALNSLGYSDFVKDAESVLQECRHVDAEKKRKLPKLKDLGIPEEELLRMQQELFAQAREKQLQQEQEEAQVAAQMNQPQPSTSSNPPST